MGNKLSEGWVNKRIKEVCHTIKDKGISGDVPYLEIGNIDIARKTYKFTEKLSVKGCKRTKRDDVLISRVRPTRGAVVNVKEAALTVSSAFTILRRKTILVDKYLWFYLAWNQKFFNYLGNNCTGTMYPTVAEKIIVDYEIPVAPLDQQNRIVKKLEVLLAKVKYAQSRLDKIPLILKGFRQSVLAAAFSGELIKTECDELEIGDLEIKVQTGPFGSTLHRSDYIDNGIPVINPMHIVDSKIISSTKVTINKETFQRLSSYSLKEGDIIFARRGEMGRCAVVDKSSEGYLCGTGSLFLRFDIAKIDPYYLQMILSSPPSVNYLTRNSVGTTMQNLNQSILKKMSIPLPSLAEQKKVVQKARNFFDVLKLVEEHFNGSKSYVDKLEQSILAKAFRGELVPQNPKNDPDDKCDDKKEYDNL